MNTPADAIYSSEKATRWLWLVMALAFLLLPAPALLAIPEELGKGNWGILLVLLFPLVGGWMGWLAWKSFREWYRFGATPLYADPSPGCAGGQVGGTIQLRVRPRVGEALRVTLQCVHVRITGSGDNRSRSESVEWQESQPALVESAGSGSALRFVFDVPADLPPSSEKDRNYHFWRLNLKGRCAGDELTRAFEVPVVRGEARAAQPLPEAHVRESRARERMRLLEEAQSQIQVTQIPGGVELYSAAGRNRHLALLLGGMGLIFSGVAAFLVIEQDAPLMMGLVFGLFGVPMLAGAIIVAGRSLRVRLADGRIEQIRYFAGRPLWRREGELTSASRLELHKASSLNKGEETVIYYHLEARVAGRGLRIAEGLPGRQLAETFRDTLIRLARLSD